MAKQLKDYKGINIAACCNISTGCSNDGLLWVALKSILSTLYNVYRQPISKSDKKKMQQIIIINYVFLYLIVHTLVSLKRRLLV